MKRLLFYIFIMSTMLVHSQNHDQQALATFGAGCFWCVEAVFEQVEGVRSVRAGYTGGQTKNPTYKQVCEGNTGHVEVCQIEYDPNIVSYATLLEIFWRTHDPTTIDRQGNDVGSQYRSAVFYHNEGQSKVAQELKTKLDQSGAWNNPIVTEILPLGKFYKAENYHQDYYKNNKDQAYCTYIIQPKLDKFKKVFADHIKK